MNALELGLISSRGLSHIVFLELQREPGVYSRVTTGMKLQSSCLFNDMRTPASYEGHIRNLREASEGNKDASQGDE